MSKSKSQGTVKPESLYHLINLYPSRVGLAGLLFTLIVLPAIIVTGGSISVEVVRLNETSHSFEVYTAITVASLVILLSSELHEPVNLVLPISVGGLIPSSTFAYSEYMLVPYGISSIDSIVCNLPSES